MKRSKHNLSSYNLFTTDMGQLIPIGLTEVIPGDTFQHSTSLLLRMSPMVAPVMHPIHVRVHHFFVPHRIIWDGWEDFITGGPDGNNSDTIPVIGTPTPENHKGSLFDYWGVPSVDESVPLSALPNWGYTKIYNEFYRDQDLVTERLEGEGMPERVSWTKDYFTTARPWEQKGPDITLPFGVAAPVVSTGELPLMTNGSQEAGFAGQNPDSQSWQYRGDLGGPLDQLYWGTETGLEADLTSATGVSVNEFRRSFALQRYQEARARYGSRYTEYLRYLGIRPKDARLQRPEYLGGGKVTVSISEVLQTAPDDPASPEYGVGDLFGHGIAALRSNRYRKFFEEYGYVHSLMSVVPAPMYSNGVDRHFLKQDKEDFYQRELQYIGQQRVFNNEIYLDATDGDNTFGYQDRYDEYRRKHSKIAGDFRDTLNYWHLARNFDSTPVLNQDFIECDPSKRIFSEQTQDSLWCMAQHRLVARRLIPGQVKSRII